MSQILRVKSDDFVLFDEPYTIKKKIPCHVSMSCTDKTFPPDNVLERGANAYAKNSWGNICLHSAVIAGHQNVTKILIKRIPICRTTMEEFSALFSKDIEQQIAKAISAANQGERG